MTEPAGITVRPLMLRSTSVVPSNRSSTCAVPEFSVFVSRTSISVPAGTSTFAAVVVDVVVREVDEDVEDELPDGVEDEPVDRFVFVPDVAVAVFVAVDGV